MGQSKRAWGVRLSAVGCPGVGRVGAQWPEGESPLHGDAAGVLSSPLVVCTGEACFLVGGFVTLGIGQCGRGSPSRAARSQDL